MDNSADQLLAFIDPSARDRVTVSGPDAKSYLQSQVAQEIRDMEVGDARWTLVLEPTGKIDSLARLTRTAEDAFEFETDAGFGAALLARLDRFKIRVDAVTTLTEAASAEPAARYESARIAAGWPRMGAEIIPGETIPAVTGIVPLAVSFTKGCYPGQELVERMESRGAEAPRSLRIVEVDDGTQPGDVLTDADGAEIAVVTSVDGTRALAYVKRGADIGVIPDHGG